MTSKRAEAEKVEAYTRALMEAARSEGRANADLVQWQHARKFSPEVLETLAAMQREDDLDLVSQVAKQYKEYLDAEDKTVSVTVTTAVPLDDDLREKVRAKAEADLKAPVYLVERVDPSIIGGIMLEARGKRYFAFMLLEAKQAYMHEVGYGESGAQKNDIARHHAILPNPSQKVPSFAVVESKTLTVSFCDKERTIAGENRWLIPDGLLQCSMEASSKEVFDTACRIVEEVAEEYGANKAVAVSKAKAYISSNADESDELAPWDLGEEVFDDEPLQKRFEEALAEEALPERVVVEKSVAKRVAKNHKIRTDTGIDITFPAEYGENPDFIEFVSGSNGLINIELKNIGSIENR